jgi:hypothetical protein
MNVLELLPQRLQSELKEKIQKKLMKMQKMNPSPTPQKPIEVPSPLKPAAKKMDCLTVELKTHVLPS